MDPTLLNELVSPWWKPIVFTAAMFLIIIAGIIVVRVTIKFDLNVWLQDRRDAKALKNRIKQADQCGHMWTLYRNSPFSLCNLCQAHIATSTLLLVRSHPEVTIVAENRDLMTTPGGGDVIVPNPFRTRQ